MNKVMAGIDLHSNNLVIGIMDMDGKRVASQKLSCKLKEVVKFLLTVEPTVAQTARCIANGYAENHLILWPWRRFSGPFLGRK